MFVTSCKMCLPVKPLIGIACLVALTSCEGSPLGATLEQTLEADPQLAETSTPTTGTDERAEADPAPEPGQADYIGPVSRRDDPPTDPDPDPPEPTVPGQYRDLNQAPEELQPYLADLAELDLLTLREPAPDPTGSTPQTRPTARNEFQPNQTITRREYARWLFAANNRFYVDEREKRIRAGVGSTAPVFKDVSPADPDFSAIQGLAEAGILPSALTGTATAVNFRPDAPLTRSDLILWKVPLDTRAALPNATVEAVQDAWGFQDATKIPALALQAVLADYQLGDFANLRRALGYTTLFQPERGVTRAEAASVLWRFGSTTEGITAEELLSEGPEEDVDANS
ncbi:MAG: S-layer homology domain-containing protein [Cyanobacteria bacterium J06627_15]